MKALLATANKGKIRELDRLLAPLGVTLVGLDAFPDIRDIPETGATFAENALIKARAGANASGLVCLADDSGLEVAALNGAPGVYSARYADDEISPPGETRDQRNVRKLLRVMAAESQRNCRFVTAMAAVAPNGAEIVTLGEWRGILAREPVGENGFGYDPVFIDPTLGLSAAQLTAEQKNARSHRNAAAVALLAAWPDFIKKI